jgi:integrase
MSLVGSITRRGAHSWRLKFEAGERDPVTGKRRTRYITIRGTRREAQAELVKRLAEVEHGGAVDPSRITIGQYLAQWLSGQTSRLAPKTCERFGQIVTHQIVPHLGQVVLQKLRPADVHNWLGVLAKTGSAKGLPLAPRTVADARRLLCQAIGDAHRLEIVTRNVVDQVDAPAGQRREVEVLDADHVAIVLNRLRDHELHALVVAALATGLRRGEL